MLCAMAMKSVHVEHEYALPPDEVFRRIGDHERFLSGKGLVCRVVVSGQSELGGVGAIREVRGGGIYFRETITAFEAPRILAYRIEKFRLYGLPLGFHHEGGDMVLQATDRGTRLVWRSRFEIRIPLVGDAICAYFARTVSRKFAALLRRAEQA